MSVKLNCKVFRTVVRPALAYGTERWSSGEKRLDVNYTRMLKWIKAEKGITRDNEYHGEMAI